MYENLEFDLELEVIVTWSLGHIMTQPWTIGPGLGDNIQQMTMNNNLEFDLQLEVIVYGHWLHVMTQPWSYRTRVGS